MPPSPGHKKELVVGAVMVIVVIALLAVVVFANKKPKTVSAKSTPTVAARTATPAASTSPAAGSSAADAYKNGTYSATGSYDSPGGTENITVSVTVQNDVVTATSATSGANDSESRQYQSKFISGYKSMVVGKPLASISLDRVSGSSLTSQGFNQAISEIKQQAQA